MSTACFAQFSLCGFFVFYMYERVLVLTSLYGACVSSCSKYKSYVTAVPLVWHLLCLPLNDDHIIEVHFISLPCSFVSGLVLSLIVTIVHTRYSYPASWFCLFFSAKMWSVTMSWSWSVIILLLIDRHLSCTSVAQFSPNAYTDISYFICSCAFASLSFFLCCCICWRQMRSPILHRLASKNSHGMSKQCFVSIAFLNPSRT